MTCRFEAAFPDLPFAGDALLHTEKYDRYPLLMSAAFLVVGGFVMGHHELWRDEVQAWLLDRDSSSAIDLLSRQKYEGHPAPWQLLLMPLTRISETGGARSRSGRPVVQVVFHRVGGPCQ
jgi:hypothetical protein